MRMTEHLLSQKKKKQQKQQRKSIDFPIYAKPQNSELPECNGAVERLHLKGRSYCSADNFHLVQSIFKLTVDKPAAAGWFLFSWSSPSKTDISIATDIGEVSKLTGSSGR